MILYSLVDFLFKFNGFRSVIFEEVDWQNSIKRILNDPESMKTASAFWCDEDGWRGWTIRDNGSYYFHDTPEKNMMDIFDIIDKKENE